MSRPWSGFLWVLLAVGAALSGGCASGPPLKEEAVSGALPPLPRPERAVGYKVVNLRDGKEEVSTLVAQTADTQTWLESSGCRAIVPRTGFAPALEFANCEGSTGTQVVKLLHGTPYPLVAGGKWAYSYAGRNTRGNEWSGRRECEVKGPARVKTATGEHDTYKVVCEDRQSDVNTVRTYYVSPPLQATVFLERYRVRFWAGAPPPDRTKWELVRQE
jgi:hypothetical protein